MELEAWGSDVFSLPASQATAAAASGLVTISGHEPPDRWRLSAGSRVGVVAGDGWEVRVKPRLRIPQLMFLLAYAGERDGWQERAAGFARERDLFAAVVAAFVHHAERALAPAPMHGYVHREEQSTTLRGRLRFAAQVSRHPGQVLPLEIAHDDFTADVEENRLVRGASERLLRVPLVPARARARLLRIRAMLEDVTPAQLAASPPPAITRLNRRYASALGLAQLILDGCSISTRRGDTAGVSFVFDMNQVFEDFLTTALTAALRRHGGRVEAQHRHRRLDEEGGIHLRPDLTWWWRGRCLAVIDAKYKALADDRFPNADAYQMLAYGTAFDLDRGYLVYARDEGTRERRHTVVGAGMVIEVRAIDVESAPGAVLEQVDVLAADIAAAAGTMSSGAPRGLTH